MDDLIFKNGWVYVNAFFYGFWIKECEFNKYKKKNLINIKSK
tara:strand:+ start:1420 stop:1545 length:126 start_codon:yes stop_codon:yes gene_type:complete